jgi:multidrug efflux pump subunit AcrA (membrane-fusion protein)
MVWLLFISIALTACKEKAEIAEVVRAIKTIRVSEQAFGKILKFAGFVVAVDSSGLSFRVAGQVKSVEVDIGNHVKKVQVFGGLDPEPYQLEVAAIEAEPKKL